MKSLVLISPLAMPDQANAMLADLGWTDDNFAVPLSTGRHPGITHRGLRATASFVFVQAVTERVSLSPALNAAVLADRLGHFNACLTLAGLQSVDAEGL